MRLAVLASASPHSRATWSGIPYFALKELKRRFGDVHVVDTPKIDRLIVKLHKFAKSHVQLMREPAIMRLYALPTCLRQRIAANTD